MYLVDTNIWLERLLDQTNSEEVRRFLDQIPSDQLLITDFSFHSIGVILNRLGQRVGLLHFVQDVFLDGGVGLVSLEPFEMQRLVEVIEAFNLDFDDAYQYVAAEKYAAVLVSFDNDFNRTPERKMTPAEILETEDKP
ncbi:MAG: PIN domain-containing protein [Chloroflexi bacterium]|nr:PIN domain-containing protein [Chloroflexota bacterium]